MPEFENCPNCNTLLINGVYLVRDDEAKAINYFTTNKSPGFCNKCFIHLAEAVIIHNRTLIAGLKDQVEIDLPNIPVITLQAPFNWNYSLVKMVTAQTVTGTGAFTELVNGWCEIFGKESPRMENKLKNGESICIGRLRVEALSSGAHAVIAADIDYAEVGQPRDMLMVCMSGTAIKISNLDILPDLNAVYDRLQANFISLKECLKFNAILVPYEKQDSIIQ